MSLLKHQQKNLSLAVEDLNGQWAGEQADHLYYHLQSEQYQWSPPKLHEPGDGYEWVGDFKIYAQEVAKQRRPLPLEFNSYVIEKPARGLFGGGPSGKERIDVSTIPHPKAGGYQRVSLLAQTEDSFVVRPANFQDKWIEHEGEWYRTTAAPLAGGFPEKDSLLAKNSVMLLNDKQKVTPWALSNAINGVTLPASLDLRCFYARNQGALVAQIVQNGKGPSVQLSEVSSQTHNGLSVIQQVLSAHALQGDIVTISFNAPAVMREDADEDGVQKYRHSDVDLEQVVEELQNTVEYCVKESLRELHVDPDELNEPLSHFVSSKASENDDADDEYIAGKVVTHVTRKDHFNITLGLHPNVVASHDLMGALKDTILETVENPMDVETRVRRSEMNNLYPMVLHAFKESVDQVGVRFAIAQLPAIFAENMLPWNASDTHMHQKDVQVLSAELSSVRERNDALERLVTAALDVRSLQALSAGLPVQTKEIVEVPNHPLYPETSIDRPRR